MSKRPAGEGWLIAAYGVMLALSAALILWQAFGA